MLCESLSDDSSRGGVRFRDGRSAVAVRVSGCLRVDVPSPSPLLRGRLAEAMEQAVEQALEAVSAPPAGIDASMSRDASLSDQLFRARAAGFHRLELSVGSLERLALSAGAMDPRDTDALVFWIAATRDRPVGLVLDAGTSSLPAYGPTVELGEILLPELVTPRISDLPVAPSPTPPPVSVDGVRGAVVGALVGGSEAGTKPVPAAVSDAAIVPPTSATPAVDVRPEPLSAVRRPRPALVQLPPRVAVAPSVSSPPTTEEPAAPKSATVRRTALDKRELDAHAEALRCSRGPRPLAQVERMFVERYVPLSDAELHGEADDFQRGARHEWAGSFAKSYAEAWSSLRVSGKRPQMVMDAPALAARTARLHGARGIELFLVDGMRYDLGCMVQDRLRSSLAGQASCAERLVLWSALPSSTAMQLECLARGAEALTGHGNIDEDAMVVRGRALSTPRRLRVGARDLVKLDLVEARLRELGVPLPERFASLADEVAAAITKHLETLPPRTLVFVFGDHGFLIDGTSRGSGPARQGGASPDEVLVPAFGWLTNGPT